MTVIQTQCSQCRNHITGKKCKAFDKIPDEIMLNEFDHKKEYPGDKGIRFEKII